MILLRGIQLTHVISHSKYKTVQYVLVYQPTPASESTGKNRIYMYITHI
jgi:hypothetical protein